MLSSCEAELVALSACCCEVLWLRGFLRELGFGVDGPTPVFCDNTAAKAVAENPLLTKALCHVARRHFFARDAIQSGHVTVPYVASESNLADALTKIIPAPARFAWAAAHLRSWTMAV